MNKIRWAVGLTTVPERRADLFPQTLGSLMRAGFDQPRIFLDGATDEQAEWYKGLGAGRGLELTVRQPRIRAFGNWVLALQELLIRNPNCHRYMIVQDDVLFLRNLRQYLDSQAFPAKGYWNLYTAFENERGIAPMTAAGKAGWVEGSPLGSQPNPDKLQRGRGALALVFSREGVLALLSAPSFVAKPLTVDGGSHSPHRSIDGAVVTAMNIAGWREHVHAPTLVNHIGAVSTIERPTGQPDYKPPLTWHGEEFSASDLLKGLTDSPSAATRNVL